MSEHSRGFNESYQGTPPWDIGRPQPEVIRLEEAGEISGSVIDLGCGTGEHCLYLDSRGHRALGVDSAPLAILKAKKKSIERSSKAEFILHDALDLGALGRTFDSALDIGLFHTFSDSDRRRYVDNLAAVVKPGGRYLMMCFSDEEPEDWGGPRRIRRNEIADSFSKGWSVDFIRSATFETNIHPNGGRAWLSKVTRRGDGRGEEKEGGAGV